MAHPSRLSLALNAKRKAVQHECLNLRPADVVSKAVQSHLLEGMLRLAQSLMEAEMQELVGTRWAQYPERQLKRYGSRHGQIAVFGRKRKVAAPRVRVIGGKEVKLASYAVLNRKDFLSEDFALAWLAADHADGAAAVLQTHLDSFAHLQIPALHALKECLSTRQSFLNLDFPIRDGVAFFVAQIESEQKPYGAIVAMDEERHTRVLVLRQMNIYKDTDCKPLLDTLHARVLPRKADDELKDIFIIPDSSPVRRAIRAKYPQATLHTSYDFAPGQPHSPLIDQEIDDPASFTKATVEAQMELLKSWSEAL